MFGQVAFTEPGHHAPMKTVSISTIVAALMIVTDKFVSTGGPVGPFIYAPEDLCKPTTIVMRPS